MSHVTRTPLSRSKGQRSTCRVGSILWRPPIQLVIIRRKLVPWGTDGRLPLSGDIRSLILEQSLTFRRASLTNLCLRSKFVSNIKLNFYRTHFLPSSKSRDTKTRTNIKNPARSNLNIVLQFKNQWSFASSHCKWRRRQVLKMEGIQIFKGS